GAQAPATWQGSSAAQATWLPPTQAPPWQVSVRVQRSPSSQAAPSPRGGSEQAPVAGAQAPARWHGSRAAQATGLPPTQAPPWQVSVRVQASPSLQALPSGLPGLLQVPVAGLQVPAVWQASLAVQVVAVPVHTPDWQRS